MADAHGKEGGHGIIQDSAIGAIEFGDGGEKESEGDIFEEVQVTTTLEEKRIRVLMIAGGVFLRIELLSDPLLVLDALVDDAVAEEKEVGGEWQCPGAGDSWDRVNGCEWI